MYIRVCVSEYLARSVGKCIEICMTNQSCRILYTSMKVTTVYCGVNLVIKMTKKNAKKSLRFSSGSSPPNLESKALKPAKCCTVAGLPLFISDKKKKILCYLWREIYWFHYFLSYCDGRSAPFASSVNRSLPIGAPSQTRLSADLFFQRCGGFRFLTLVAKLKCSHQFGQT